MINDKKLWSYHQTDNVKNLEMGYPRQEYIYRLIHKHSSEGKVLEIGFGDGYLLKKLEKEFECYGVDISQENIKKVANNLTNVTFSLINTDGKLPFPDSFFDLFIASEVLEHMGDKELSICISEILRILKKDGAAIITVPAEENLNESRCFCPNCGEIFHKWGHKQSWNVEKIRSIFHNFKTIYIKRRIFNSPGLNIFGITGLFIKKLLVNFMQLKQKNSNFIITLIK